MKRVAAEVLRVALLAGFAERRMELRARALREYRRTRAARVVALRGSL